MSMSFNKVPQAFQAKGWIIDGWNMFKKKPLTWVLMVLIFGIIFMVGGNSILGNYIVALIAPVLAGGIYFAAHKSSNGEPISIEDLFAMFKQPPKLKQLLIIGGFGMIVVTITFYVQTFMGGDGYDPARKMSFNTGVTTFSGLVSTLVSWVWSLALLFGVPLVVIKNEQAIPALKSSINASIANLIPLIFFYLASIILFILAILPFGLGLLVLVPVLFCASYSFFKIVYLDNV